MGESKIKMSRFGRVSGTFKPNKVLRSKNSANPNPLNVEIDPEKKKNVNLADVGKQTRKAVRNLSPPQRFNEALLDYPNM